MLLESELKEIIWQNSKSFYFSTWFLPNKTRYAIWCLYAFCRLTDDLIDNNPQANTESIRAWQKDFNSEKPLNRFLQAFKQIITEYKIPIKYANELIEGCASDLDQKQYQTFAELENYCYKVASTVGLMSAYILGFDENKKQEMEFYAIKAGIALQITNILRDIAEDLGRGRIYIPQEDFVKFGCNYLKPSDWPEQESFKNLLKFQIARAKAFYKESYKGLRFLKWPGCLSTSLALVVYAEILSKIEENNFAVLEKRAYISLGRKLSLIPKAFCNIIFH